jgi:hypothetical protein
VGDLSIEKAKDCYSVAIDPKTFEVDIEKTKELRQTIIEDRLKMGNK